MTLRTNRCRELLKLAAIGTMLVPLPLMAQDALPSSLADIGTMEDLAAKAKAEGSVLVYGAPSQDKFAEWVKPFETEYGIPVQYYRAPTNQVYQRFTQEQQVGRNQADAMALSDLNLFQDGIDKGFFTPYTPQTADKFPDDVVVDGWAYPMYITVQAVGWNTRVVPEDLQERLQREPLEALLDPRLKGRIAAVTVTSGGSQIASNANIVFNQADKYGWTYLESLAQQDVAVVNNTTTALDSVIAGDFWVTTDANPSVFAPKVVDGAPIAFASPETASATPFLLAIANHAPHPFAARLFQEWAMSQEAQEALAVIAEADVTFEGWTDRRKIVEQPWYVPAAHLWFGASTDPRLMGDDLAAFYERWNTTFKR